MTQSHFRDWNSAAFGSEVTLQLDMAWTGILSELRHAVFKHGMARTPLNPKLPIVDAYVALVEEVGEVAHELTYDAVQDGGDKLDGELVQVAAMAVAMIVGTRMRREQEAQATRKRIEKAVTTIVGEAQATHKRIEKGSAYGKEGV